MSGKKKRRALIAASIVLLVIIVIPFVVAAVSLIGRIAPDSVIPDSFDLYATVPDPVHLAGQVLGHASLPDIMALAEMAPLMPILNQVRDSGLTENRWIRMAAKGRLDAAFLSGERILAAWDAGVLSPLLKILPFLAGRVTVPDLYYVQAGKNSRFEYRMRDGTVFFIGPYKNLLILSNNSALFESVLAGSSRDGDRVGSAAKGFYSRKYDAAFLLSPAALMNVLGGGDLGGKIATVDPQVLSALNLLQFSGPVEASLSVLPDQLKINLATPLTTSNQALQKIIERNSQAASLSAMIPGSTQYMTLVSAGSLEELLNGAAAIAAGNMNSEFENMLKKADSSARMVLGMNMDELLFSWTGSQFAIYGLEGRPNPVIAIEIKDEIKRKEIFDRAFQSVFLSENVRLNLDGNRIPRIQIPDFLNSVLRFMGVNVPSPYYTVQNNCLLVSESAETLLAAVNAIRRNEVLPKTDIWRTLSEDNSGPSSFSIFYSLDRSLPFFLKGSGPVTAVLKLYRQGLARVHFENRVFGVSLSVIPGAGKGIVPAAGYPLELGGRTGSSLYRVFSGRDTRLLLTRGGSALAVNPLDREIRELQVSGSPGTLLYNIPASTENAPETSGEAAWVVNTQGQVILVNRNMEPLRGFPLNTGIQLSAPPRAWGGKVFLSGEDGSVYTVNSGASVNRWGNVFPSALRSPPSFFDYKNKTYAAVYPKSFIFGEIWLLDLEGGPLPRWPVPVSGIAFGSPLLFSGSGSGSGKTESSTRSGQNWGSSQDRLLLAFITQAGELSIYTENAETLPGFPIELPGVFYLQPVFDGESLWIIESEGTLYRVELNGEILSHKIPRLSVKEGGYITATGIGGDSPGEVFFTGEGNALYGYSRNFNSLDGFPLPIWGRPVIGDLNGDGKAEAAGVGMDNRLHLWQFR